MNAGQPQRLGRYELLEVLGHGAMGVVYKAHDAFLDRVVAVKTYRQDVPITDDVKRRFEREVRTASKLVHPNVVVVHDGGLELGVPFLAMEFIDGPTLGAELRRRGRLPTEEAVRILLEIAEGLSYAHAHGVVHRDLKPANILLSDGHAKIADFGVAKLMSAGTAATTTPVGTPSYMAPEQIAGRSVDARTDVFALAILTYEVLTGRAPFAGEGWTQVLYQIMNVEPEAPTHVDSNLPSAVNGVIAEALAKDPAKRTADVKTFAANLRNAFAAEPAPRRPPPPAEAAMHAPPPSERAEHAPFEGGEFDVFRDLAPRKSQATLIWPVFAVVALLALLFVVIAYHRFGPQQAKPAPTEATPAAAATSPPATQVPAVQPTQARVEPTQAPRVEPTPAPRPTEAPRPEPTAARLKPTAAPKPQPTAEIMPTAAPAPEAATGKPTIDVISEPPGAEVIVNGASKGRTPVRIADLDPGSYDFEVRKEGYNSYLKTTKLEPESDYTMRITLPATVNSLRVVSQPPGVTIKLNGDVKGRTPITVSQLPSGHYQVSAELEGFPTQTVAVDLKDGELQEVRFTFTMK